MTTGHEVVECREEMSRTILDYCYVCTCGTYSVRSVHARSDYEIKTSRGWVFHVDESVRAARSEQAFFLLEKNMMFSNLDLACKTLNLNGATFFHEGERYKVASVAILAHLGRPDDEFDIYCNDVFGTPCVFSIKAGTVI